MTNETSNSGGIEWARGNIDRRCVATSRAGTRCRNWAIRGGAVCRYHGGSTAHIKNKARERIDHAQDLVAMRMIGFAIDEGVPPNVALAAAKDILDRGGMAAPTQVEVELKPYEELLDGLAGIDRGITRAESRAQRGLPPEPAASAAPVDPNAPLDVEVVEDPARDVGAAHPDGPSARRTPADEGNDPPTRPAFATDDGGPRPSNALMTMEEAVDGQRAYIRSSRIRRRR